MRSPKSRNFNTNSCSFVDAVHYKLLKHNMSKKELARRMRISVRNLEELLKPGCNITLNTISMIEEAMGEELIIWRVYA